LLGHGRGEYGVGVCVDGAALAADSGDAEDRSENTASATMAVAAAKVSTT
jgi:hypothetical protein